MQTPQSETSLKIPVEDGPAPGETLVEDDTAALKTFLEDAADLSLERFNSLQSRIDRAAGIDLDGISVEDANAEREAAFARVLAAVEDETAVEDEARYLYDLETR